MSKPNSGLSCALGCWAMAAAAALLTLIMLLVVGNWGLIAALFMAGLAFVVLGILFSFLFCRELPPLGGAEEDAAAQANEAAAAAPAQKPAASATVPAAAPAPSAEAAPKAKPAADPAPAAKPAPAATPKPAAKAEPAAAPVDGGTKPEGLSEARDGKADDLKAIKGVGPKLEKLLNSMGYFHFDQIAAWGANEVAWVDENLQGFKGRVSRDNWVEQAKILAEGGATEFSKRVDDGDVY